MIQFRQYILFTALLMIVPPVVQATPVAPHHEVYAFLERVNVKYGLNLFLATRPLHKRQIIAALGQLEKHSTELTQWERRRFHYLRRQFLIHLRKQDSYLVYQHNSKELQGRASHSTHINYLDSIPDARLFAFGTLNVGVEGQLDSSLSFISKVTFAQERTLEDQFSEHYNSAFGLPYNTPDKANNPGALHNVSTFDGYRALISWNKGNLTFDFGNDWNQWGPGTWQHPTLAQDSWFWSNDSSEIQRAWHSSLGIHKDSLAAPVLDSINSHFLYRGTRKGYTRPGESAPITQVRGSVQWDFLKYTKFFGEKTGLHFDSTAYLVGHRLETRLGGFTVGLHEILTYTRDEIEFGYMIPFVSLFMTEHFTGDRDNIAMGMDVQYTFNRRFRIYAELFLDDLVGPGDFFTDYYGNKTAPLAGMDVYDVLIPDTELKFEYARVDPWVYSHVSGKNQFQNLGSLTGSSLPPNSHSFRMQFSKYLLMGLDLYLNYRFFQRQYLTEGSSLFDTQPLLDTRKNFLGQDPETIHDISTKLGYRWDRHIRVGTILGYHFTRDWRSTPGKDFTRLKWQIMWQMAY